MKTLHHTSYRGKPLLKSAPGIFLAAIVIAAFSVCAPLSFGQEAAPVKVAVSQTSTAPQAIVLSVHGKCSFADDGSNFTELKAGKVLGQGAVVRTGPNSRADLFFRRIGTTVRLQAGTEVQLEKMARQMKDGKPAMETLLNLKSGRIFTAVRSLVPGSTLEIRNAAGRSVVEGAGGNGRYIITADGTHVTDKDSAVPLKVVGETGITIIKPGQKFNSSEGKVFAAAPPAAVEELIDLDEIQSLAEELTAPVREEASDAVILSVGPNSTADKKGEGFAKLRAGQVLAQGAVIRSGDEEVIDLFLRRWGTTVRLMPNTELALDKMSRTPGANGPALRTLLDLRKGRIFCFIRIPVPESVFEIKTQAGLSVLKSQGAGRYDIRANGAIVTGLGSFRQLQVVTEKGVVMITPGQKFTPEDGHLMPAAPSEVELLMIQMDQLVALAEQLSSENAPVTDEVLVFK